MKKIMVLVGALMVFVACKKDRVCSCTVNGAEATSYTIKNKTKSDAKAECDEGDASVSVLGFTVITECELN
ncbi:MAG: hypothetical protein MK105_14220 [Crocinitomicaceae bacterium]|nr:hypothetical protein [Crocinitomicaceae bacterium]